MRRVVASGAAVLGIALVGLCGSLVLGTVLAPSRQPQVEATSSGSEVDVDAVAERLGQALALPTVSSQDPADIDPRPFLLLHGWLARTYPHAHVAMERETINDLSLLYTWQGTDPDLPPVLLMAHTDVVPVAPDAADKWTWPPFSGTVADGFVWGRGAIDMKPVMIGLMEAIEGLAAEGWRPPRTVMLAFGHDEEVGGEAGNAEIRALLERRGQRLAWVLDEGLVVTDGIVPGLAPPAALIGVAEKGYLSLELVVEGTGGHSSMPPPQTAAGVVAAAVTRLEAAPFPAAVDGPAGEMFDWLAPEMGLPMRVVFSNRWLLGPVVLSQLAAKPNTNATTRTTIAVTQLEASLQDNVLPQRARAVVNLRLHPRDSIASATERVRAIIDDPRVELRPLAGTLYSEPSPVTPSDGAAFSLVARTIRQVRPDVVVAPGLMIGGTDSRYYVDLADAVLRFHPYWMGPGDSERIHGRDERISVDNLSFYVDFYRRLLQNLEQEGARGSP